MTIPDSAYGTMFYLTTGFHGLHVTGGLIAFLFVLGPHLHRAQVHPRAGGQRHRRVLLLALRRRGVDRPVRDHLPHPVAAPARNYQGLNVRFLNRSAGRLSRHRRGPLAGLVLLLLGPRAVRHPLRRVRRPAQAHEARRPTRRRSPRAVSSSWSAARSATARTARASAPSTASSTARRWSASVPPPSTSRSAPAGCRWPSPAPRPRARPPAYDEEEIAALAAYVASLGPGPAIPDAADYSLEGLTDEEREEAVVRGGQIFLTNCTACHNFAGSGGAMPRGRLRPDAPRRRAHATSTRRC